MKIKINTIKRENIEIIGENDCSLGFTQLKDAVNFINTFGEPNETYILIINLDDGEEGIVNDNLLFKRNMRLKLETSEHKLLLLSGDVTVDDTVEVQFSNIHVERLKVKESRIHDYEFIPLIHVKKCVHGDPCSPANTPTIPDRSATPSNTTSSSTPTIPDRSFTPSTTPPVDNLALELQSVYVKTDGDDQNDGSSIDTAKRTIQNAINVAPSKGSIIVLPGSYDENITIDKSLTLFGENVFINGGQKGSCITCTQGTISITGFTIINGKNDNGGGIYNEANLTLIEVKVLLNTAESGAGVYNANKLTLINSRILYNNATDNGGGIYANNLLKVCRSMITGNTAAHRGGGICGAEGKVIITTSHVDSNNSRQGGGIFSRSGLKISDTEICSNTAQDYGGGVYNTSDMDITASIFRNNGTGKEGSGGAIYNLGTFKTARDTVFMLNICGLNGGAIYNKADSNMIMCNAIFTGNEGFNGGAVYNDGSILITEASYMGNIARNFAGAVYNSKTGSIMFNQHAQYTILFNNNFAYAKGGAIYTQSKINLERIEKGRNYPEFMIKE